jgi:hypothetical protein
MKRMTVVGLLMVATLMGAPAMAQIGFGVGGGPSFPTGSLGDHVDAGFHAGLVADIGLPFVPLGVRGDLIFQRLPGTAGNEAFQQISGVVNGRFNLVPLPLVATYVTAGAGLYSSSWGLDEAGRPANVGSNVDIGLNAGLGTRVNFLLVRPFAEIRYHRVLGDPTRAFVPVTLGVYF